MNKDKQTIIELLKVVLTSCPHLRMGQLIIDFMDYANKYNLYYLEDQEFIKLFKKYIKKE